MKKIVLVIIGLTFISALTAGCETLKGMGKDLENTGNNIQELLTRND